jgi:hypothetical protein
MEHKKMKQTDTLRTDAIEFRHCPPQPKELLKKHQDAYALCRELERELAASNAENIRLRAENVCLQELIEEFYEWSRRDYPTEAEVREIMDRYYDMGRSQSSATLREALNP